MATPMPPALATSFYRAVRSCRPQTYRSIRNPPAARNRKSSLHTAYRQQQQEQGYQRYGSAATPSMPPPSKPTDPFLPSTEQTNRDATDLEARRTDREKQEIKEKKDAKIAKEDEQRKGEDKEPNSEEDAEVKATPEKPQPTTSDAQADQAQQKTSEPQETPLANKELDMVLSIPTPTEIKGNGTDSSSSHPHLEASPYEHHFDTYTLVQDLCKPTRDPDDPNVEPQAPFSNAQSVTLMKAIRLMLASNLDLAKDGLVSKSDTENETYLFRAACSELKTTMQTSRFMEAQKQRSQRAQLQHEFDILSQKVSQDIMTMREELKGMFNDRKLGLQEEKRQVDGKIQGLNYQITVDLNSEAKSEVEGLRWVLTRRAAMAIAGAVGMTLAFLQYYSVKSRELADVEKKRKAAEREQERFMGGGTLAAGARSAGTQTDGIVLGGAAGGNCEESLG